MLQKIMAILSLFPVLISAIKSVEEAIPGTGLGKTKINMILDTVLAVSESAKDMIPLLTSTIGIIVAGFNTAKVFTKD